MDDTSFAESALSTLWEDLWEDLILAFDSSNLCTLVPEV